MDGRFIEGYALEVSYKPAVPIPQGHFNIRSSEQQRVDYPVPMQMAPPPPTQLWTGPAGPNPFVAPPLPPISPPQQPPNFTMWQYANPTPMEVVQPVIRTLPALQPPAPLVAPEPSPPPPYSALPPIRETDSQGSASGSPEPMANIDTSPPKAPSDPCNLFVKNLDDEVIVTQRDLEKLFAAYGTITSTFLATYAPKDDNSPPVSKGFGFVAFARAQEAELAKDKLHGQIVGRKKIFVSYAERKEERHSRLKLLFANMESLADQMKRDIIAKADGEEVSKEMKDDGVSSRGVTRPQEGQRLDEGIGPGIPVARVPPRLFPSDGVDGRESYETRDDWTAL
jgi:RNA recognition motif. (a.k.a. RRM, RBD, or RNP domain)